MKPITSIIVPGAAGPAGINTIKSLKMAGFTGKIIATDSSKLSAGFFMASAHEVMPKVAEEELFLKTLFEVIKKYRVQVLMPSSGYDIYPYSKYRKQIEEESEAVAPVSDIECVRICHDKVMTYEKLKRKFILPFTTEDPEKITEFPIIAKPRQEKGGDHLMVIEDEDDLKYASSKYDNATLFQEFLPGTEYTVDVLCDLDKKPLVAIPRIRLETKGGVSTKGKVVRNIEIEETCRKVAELLGIRGPCCIQLKESKEGVPKLVEVNPRMGGGTIFATLAGVNFPALLLDMISGKKVEVPEIREVTVVRYLEEIVV